MKECEALVRPDTSRPPSPIELQHPVELQNFVFQTIEFPDDELVEPLEGLESLDIGEDGIELPPPPPPEPEKEVVPIKPNLLVRTKTSPATLSALFSCIAHGACRSICYVAGGITARMPLNNSHEEVMKEAPETLFLFPVFCCVLHTIERCFVDVMCVYLV